MLMKIVKEQGHANILVGGKVVAQAHEVAGAVDSFVEINEIAYLWKRKCDTPVTEMKMHLTVGGEAGFTMIPAVNYNGNGWGTMPEYTKDRDENGEIWKYAYHRITIPSCTYTQTSEASIALMAHEDDVTSCSLYREDDCQHHVIMWPEVEGPRTLQRHFWGEPYQGSMEPCDEFEVIIVAYEAEDKPIRYDRLLDFAWRYYAHPIAPPMQPEELKRLGLAYSKFLYEEEENGFCGFTMGSQWYRCYGQYMKTFHRYEISWVGQSALMANMMLLDYLETKNKESLRMGLAAHDSWLKFSENTAGIVDARIDFHEWRNLLFDKDYKPDIWKLGECEFETHMGHIGKTFRRDENGRIILQIDACNVGGAADAYFEAYDLAKKCGYDKPEYEKMAYAICDFAIKTQASDGRFAKSWENDGKVRVADGTIGCFLVLPLLTAYKRSGKQEYFDSALRAFNYYYEALERDGFTTAGALDTYSIDKESSSPLLRDAIALYEITQDKAFITKAENIAWYLRTWLMHYTIKYPEDSLIAQMGYDTFGSTSVSTPHQALDQYALRDVISFLKLAEYTGNTQWKEVGVTFWCNACQGISDGTMYLNGRLRPAGSQDEAIFHTRWSRRAVGPFRPSQWLPAWPIAFRLETLAAHPDWSVFREGLTEIKDKIVVNSGRAKRTVKADITESTASRMIADPESAGEPII